MAEFVNCSSDSSQFVGNSGSSWLCWEVTTLPLRLQENSEKRDPEKK